MEVDKESRWKVIQEIQEERMSRQSLGQSHQKNRGRVQTCLNDVSVFCFPEGAHLPTPPEGLSLLYLVQHNSKA